MGRGRWLVAWWLAADCAAQPQETVVRRDVHSLLIAPLARQEIAHRITVNGDADKAVGFLELSGLEEVADAAYAFGVTHKVGRASTRRLAAAVCAGSGLTKGARPPPCTREAAMLYENEVSDPTDETGARALNGTLRIWEGQDALDAVFHWMGREDMWLGDWFPPALVESLCQVLTAPLWACPEAKIARSVPINLGGKTKLPDLELRAGEEAADGEETPLVQKATLKLVALAQNEVFLARS